MSGVMFEGWTLYFNVAQWLVTVVLAVTVWLRKPGEDAAKAVSALTERVIAIETEIKHMPTNDELANLEGSIKQLDERTEGLAEAIDTVRQHLNRIETYLLTPK